MVEQGDLFQLQQAGHVDIGLPLIAQGIGVVGNGRAERLLSSKGVADMEKIDVSDRPDLWKEMERRTGRNTVPQIYIGERHVGGCDDLYDLESAGKLDQLLAG